MRMEVELTGPVVAEFRGGGGNGRTAPLVMATAVSEWGKRWEGIPVADLQQIPQAEQIFCQCPLFCDWIAEALAHSVEVNSMPQGWLRVFDDNALGVYTVDQTRRSRGKSKGRITHARLLFVMKEQGRNAQELPVRIWYSRLRLDAFKLRWIAERCREQGHLLLFLLVLHQSAVKRPHVP